MFLHLWPGSCTCQQFEMKWQINRHSDVTCEVIPDTDRAKHTVIHGYECCSTLSRAVCDKSNVMYSSRVVFELSWESSVSNATVRSRCYVTGTTRRLGWAARHNETHRSRTRSRDLTSWLLRRRTGHQSPPNFSSRVGRWCQFCRSLLDNKEEFNHAYSLFVRQSGGLGCFKCASCAKPSVPELVIGRVHPWVGLGRFGSKTMGHLTQSLSNDDVYKLNISYQCIKKWHRRDLRRDPSRPDLFFLCGTDITDLRSRLSAGKVENTQLVRLGLRAGILTDM